MNDFLFILQFDSFVSTLVPVIRQLRDTNYNVTTVLMIRHFEKYWISENIKEMLDGIPWQTASEREIYSFLDKNYQVVVIGSVPRKFMPRFVTYSRKKGYATRFAAGYVGLLLKNHSEGYLRGVRRRALCDLIWTPGIEAEKAILNTGLIDTMQTKVIPTGIPRFDALFEKLQQQERNVQDEILFLEQPTFPKSKAERQELLLNLIRLAENHPQFKIILKPRFAEKTGHTHQLKYSLPELMKDFKIPPNLSVSNEPILKLFQTARYALTISSTAGVEAMLAGIPTWFIQDFCGKENRYGSHDFTPLGVGITFKKMLSERRPWFNREYKIFPEQQEQLQQWLRFDGQNTTRLTEAMRNLHRKMPAVQPTAKTIFFLGRYMGRFPLIERFGYKENFRKLEKPAFENTSSLKQVFSPQQADIIFFRNKPEGTKDADIRRMEKSLSKAKPNALIINPIQAFETYDSKDLTFTAWRKADLQTPDFIVLPSDEKLAMAELNAFRQKYAQVILRTNNETGGKGMQMLSSADSVETVHQKINEQRQHIKILQKKGVSTRLMAVEFADTADAKGYRATYRAHTVCGKILCYYGITSPKPFIHSRDMLPTDYDQFVEVNRLFHVQMQEKRWDSEIIKAVESLGCQVGAVDFLLKNNQPVFLEVNTMWGFRHKMGSDALWKMIEANRWQLESIIPTVYAWYYPLGTYHQMYEIIAETAREKH
jgi:glutathione synthase/RimK-type ligase-like ATP-grasp enzyme